MFHARGLNAIEPREMKSEGLEKSTRSVSCISADKEEKRKKEKEDNALVLVREVDASKSPGSTPCTRLVRDARFCWPVLDVNLRIK